MGASVISSLSKQQGSGANITQRDFRALQDRVEQVTAQIQAQRRPQLSSEIIEDVSLTTGDTTLVTHKLERAWKGWRVVDITADATVWRDDTSDADPNVYLALTCSADVTINLEVW